MYIFILRQKEISYGCLAGGIITKSSETRILNHLKLILNKSTLGTVNFFWLRGRGQVSISLKFEI